MGGRPRWRSVASRVYPARSVRRDTSKARCRGRSALRGGTRCGIQNWSHVLSGAAARLKSAWEQWRALHGLAVAPGQPVVSYVGYSLKSRGVNPGWSSGSTLMRPNTSRSSSIVTSARSAGGPRFSSSSRFSSFRFHQVPHQLGPHPQVPRSEPPPESTGEYTSSALLGAPVNFGMGRPSPDHLRDIAAELAGWASGELPGQVTEQLTSWPPGAPMTSDQPPAGPVISSRP